MKRIVFSSLAVLSAAMLVFSCVKETSIIEPLVEPLAEAQEETEILVTINTGKPDVDALTKTEIYGGEPYWSVSDVIGVSDGTSSNKSFNTGITEPSATASFSGTVDAAGDYYAYYPYTGNGVGRIGEDPNYKWGAKVDLPVNQSPTATSYDGGADVMVSKQFNVTETTPTVDNLEFARLGAIVKIVLKDNENLLTGQHPSTVSMTAENALAGRVLINMQDQCLEDPYYNPSNTVNANYNSSTKYEIDGTNATYLVVVPQTLAAGTTLTITASTEGYSIEKSIPIPDGGIALEAGKITTLNIGLNSSHITASSGAALPFNDDFSWQTASGNAITSVPSDKYSAFNTLYADKGAGKVRMSTGTTVGYLITKELNLSSAFHVIVNAEIYNTNQTKIKVSVDDGEAQVASEYLGEAKDYIFNFPAATNKSKVKVFTEGKQAVLNSIQVETGTYVFPSHTITIDDGITHGTVSTSPSGSAEEGAEVTITATPDDGYVLTSLNVTDGSSNPVPVSENKFTMPTSNVTVTATFAKSGSNETMTFSELYNSNTTIDGTTINGTNFSVVFTKRDGGTATQYYTTGSAVRWYGGGTLVVSAKGGKTITGITLSFGGTKGNAITAGTGSYTDDSANGTGSWSGSASSVTFTQAGSSGHDRISAITVTYTN